MEERRACLVPRRRKGMVVRRAARIPLQTHPSNILFRGPNGRACARSVGIGLRPSYPARWTAAAPATWRRRRGSCWRPTWSATTKWQTRSLERFLMVRKSARRRARSSARPPRAPLWLVPMLGTIMAPAARAGFRCVAAARQEVPVYQMDAADPYGPLAPQRAAARPASSSASGSRTGQRRSSEYEKKNSSESLQCTLAFPSLCRALPRPCREWTIRQQRHLRPHVTTFAGKRKTTHWVPISSSAACGLWMALCGTCGL